MSGWTYTCPFCGALLNPERAVILVGGQGDQRVLIGFHPEPGNYELFLPPEATLREGDHWDFFCPVCREDLVNGQLGELVELRLRSGDAEDRVFFSRIAGEHATFILSGRQVQAEHGPHVERYRSRLMPVRF